MSKLFGLVAGGIEWLSEAEQTYTSKRLFRSREEAERDSDDFIRRCCEPAGRETDCFKPDTISVEVVEFDLVEPQ